MGNIIAAIKTFWTARKTRIYIGLIIAAVVANFSLFIWFYYKGYNVCEAKVVTKTVEKVITVKEKQDEIRNNKPSVVGTANRLRNANF